MNDDIDKPDLCVVALSNGKWSAYLHRVLVTDLRGQTVEFDTEDDARAFLAELAARASSVDS